MKFSRYRLVKFLIIAVPIFYLFMVEMKSVLNSSKDEIFPFFSWRLFPDIPPWHKTGHAVILHAADDDGLLPLSPTPSSATRYLIPSRSNEDRKVLRQAVGRCWSAEPDDCTEAVVEWLYPTVMALAGRRDVEFSIVGIRIDLRDVQLGLHEILQGKAKSDYYRADRIIGRWNTHEGPVDIRELASTTRILEHHWDVYQNNDRLIYVKETCSIEDVSSPFYLHLIPANIDDLPDDRKQYGFDNLDFRFANYRMMSGSARECIALRRLPDYAITRLRTGQFIGDNRLWQGIVDFAPLNPSQPERDRQVGDGGFDRGGRKLAPRKPLPPGTAFRPSRSRPTRTGG